MPWRPPSPLQGDGVRLIEPLQHLLAGVRRVLLAAAHAPPGDESERPRFNLLDIGGDTGGELMVQRSKACLFVRFLFYAFFAVIEG